MINEVIAKLMDYARKKLSLDKRDELYARNQIIGILGLDSYGDTDAVYRGETVETLLSELIREGVSEGLFEECEGERICDEVMGALMLSPHEVDDAFAARMRISPKRATDWFYTYCIRGNYVKKEKLDKNPRFTADNGLIVTINLAKPEFRDPKKAASGNSTKGGYPKCTICRSNEGFGGRNKRTLRTVSIRLDGENWFWQYSPYGYFNQHGIAVNEKHIPMHVDKSTFFKLMDFVDMFPQYFIGCNACLPRIGGSVLAHDHYQGGGERLPIFNAGIAYSMRHKGFPEIKVGVLDWYGTAIRLTGANRTAVATLADYIRLNWENYRNDELGIIPQDDDGVHSAISPTVVKGEDGYEMTLILRNNITSEQYPDGVFHAHPEFHVIKKESIGLIEAQGLFILPGRLVGELTKLKDLLISGEKLPEEMSDYAMIFGEMKEIAPSFTEDTARAAIEKELGSICERILKNTAVFKSHEETAEYLKGIGFYEN